MPVTGAFGCLSPARIEARNASGFGRDVEHRLEARTKAEVHPAIVPEVAMVPPAALR